MVQTLLAVSLIITIGGFNLINQVSEALLHYRTPHICYDENGSFLPLELKFAQKKKKNLQQQQEITQLR